MYGLLGVKCPYHCIEGTILDDESCLSKLYIVLLATNLNGGADV